MLPGVPDPLVTIAHFAKILRDDPSAGVTGRGPLIERRRTARDIRDQAIISGITVVSFDRLG
jgi:hypothetical protein